MTRPLYSDTDPQEMVDLRVLIDEAFSSSGENARLIREAMSYRFNPTLTVLDCKGLSFDVILNHARLSYVQGSLKRIRRAQQTTRQKLRAGEEHTKRSLRPHMPAPGDAVCVLCDLERSPLLFKRLCLGNKEYGLVVNKRPWGYNNFMLVAMDPEPQSMTYHELLASFELMKSLGSDYEAIFTGVLAGASVYHFHLQVHKGSAAIWRNLERGSIHLRQFLSVRGITASSVDGWPAHLFAFEGCDNERLAFVVHCMIETLVKGNNDFPYNIGFRCQGKVIHLILIPRSGEEQPTCIQGHLDSWGRFGFLEMAGSVFLLTPAVYEAIGKSGHQICDAISEMSILQTEQAELISDFQTSVKTRV